MSFQYKNVLVLGATSGIGLALAEKIIGAGAHVIAVGRRQEKLDDLVSKHGKDKVSAEKFDITDLKGIPDFVERVTKNHSKLDMVLMNAGIQRGMDFTKPDSIDLDTVYEEFNTNYLSYLHLTKYFLPHLQSASFPTAITFVTSGLALIPLPRCPNYCASKAALHHLVLSLRVQLQGGNVKIIELLPPAVQTELHDAKHQPDIKDGGKIGMPLDEFTEEAWKGLIEGKEQIPVGMSVAPYEEGGFETMRQKAFQGMVKRMSGGS